MPREVISGFASTPPPEKCSGDLEKFSALDLGGNFRICEYTATTAITTPYWWRHIQKVLDVVNMKEIWRNMRNICKNMFVENMNEYVENMKEYVENMK